MGNPSTQSTDGQPNYEIKIQSSGIAEWTWLQPYKKEREGLKEPLEYDAYRVGAVAEKAGSEYSPYTAIESFWKSCEA
jgi:hypothetical protein